MYKFGLLDTPEYEHITNNMKGVTKYLEMANCNIVAYDIKSGLVFEFYEVRAAIEYDNKQFIIFENTMNGVTIHTHKNNFLLLVEIIVNFYDSEITNELIKTIIQNSTKLLQKEVSDQLIKMIADLLCKDGTEYIKCPINDMDITIDDLHKISQHQFPNL